MINHTQNTVQHHFYRFLKDTWILKSSCSLKSPKHASDATVVNFSLKPLYRAADYTYCHLHPSVKQEGNWSTCSISQVITTLSSHIFEVDEGCLARDSSLPMQHSASLGRTSLYDRWDSNQQPSILQLSFEVIKHWCFLKHYWTIYCLFTVICTCVTFKISLWTKSDTESRISALIN